MKKNVYGEGNYEAAQDYNKRTKKFIDAGRVDAAAKAAAPRTPAEALEMIEPLAPQLNGYFHFFGLRGALLQQLGRDAEARVAFDRAIALAQTPAEAAHIRMNLDNLSSARQTRKPPRVH